MKKLSVLLRLLLPMLAVAALVTPITAHATFIIDPNPGGMKFYIDKANKDASSFWGSVDDNNSNQDVKVSATGIFDTGAGYSNIKPVKNGLLTNLIFTPADIKKYGDFSFRGHLEKDGFTGEVIIKVIGQYGTYNLDFTNLAGPNADFDRIGVYSKDGDWIESVEIWTTGPKGFNEVKQIEFSNQAGTPVPEPGTFLLLGISLAGLGFFGRRKLNK